jgi:hypothetical protein
MEYISARNSGRFNCLVVGPSGIGKTSLLRTIPENEPVFTMSAESGLLSVKDLVDSGRVSGAVIRSVEDVEECLACFQTNPDWQAAYRWIFIDSLSEIASLAEAHVKARHESARDTFKMWGEYNDLMFRLVKSFRDLAGQNVVFTALETVEVDEVKRRHPSLAVAGKQFKERLPSLFDEVFRMAMAEDGDESGDRILITACRGGFPAKDRSGRLAAAEKPDLGLIQAKIQGV